MDRESLREFARVENWQRDHLKMHQSEVQARRSERRWIVSGVIIPTIAVLASSVGIIVTFLVTHR